MPDKENYFRWKRGEDGQKVFNQTTSKAILQFIAVMRRDSGEWAIPGVKLFVFINFKGESVTTHFV